MTSPSNSWLPFPAGPGPGIFSIKQEGTGIARLPFAGKTLPRLDRFLQFLACGEFDRGAGRNSHFRARLRITA